MYIDECPTGWRDFRIASSSAFGTKSLLGAGKCSFSPAARLKLLRYRHLQFQGAKFSSMECYWLASDCSGTISNDCQTLSKGCKRLNIGSTNLNMGCKRLNIDCKTLTKGCKRLNSDCKTLYKGSKMFRRKFCAAAKKKCDPKIYC